MTASDSNRPGAARDLAAPLQHHEGQDVEAAKSSLFCAICNVLLNTFLLLVSIILLPIVALILLFLCLLPALDKLTHPCRDYLDGVGAAQINNIPEAIIHLIVISKERVSAETVFKRFDETYVTTPRPEFARFRERVVKRAWLWPYWTPATNFEPDKHFRPHSEPITKDEFEKSIADMQLELFDLDHPVWQLRHYENYTDENGKACSATLFRVHHAMADGFTGMRVMMQGATPNKPPANPNQQAAERGDRRPKPGCVKILCYFLTSIKKLVLMQDDKPSIFKSSVPVGPLGKKNVAWSSLRDISVDDLKLLGKSLGGVSINDVLLTALTGSLRTYNCTEGGASIPTDVTTCMWASLAPLKHIYTDFKEKPLKWGNSTLGAVYLKLPVGEQHSGLSALDSLALLRKSTADPSLMVEAGVATRLMSLFGWLPGLASKVVWGPMANKVSVSMSNVPGPQFDFDWCGMPCRSLLFFVPPTGKISLFVTIATCNGEISIGMGVDAAIMSHEALQKISGVLFEAEIRKLIDEAPSTVAINSA